MSLAALGAIAGGLNQGFDLAQRDQEVRDQRQFREEDRSFKKLQQDDLLARQKRENEKALRDEQYGKDYAAANGPVTEMKAVTGKPALDAFANEQPLPADVPVQRPRTELERLSAVNAAQVKGQRYAEADQTQQAIRKIFTDVDRQNHNTLVQSAGNMDMGQLATAAQKLVTADGSPLIVDAPNQNTDGSYTFNVRNKWNGASMPFTAKNKEELLRGLQYHMDYDTYAANAKARLDAQTKIDEAPITSVPGGYFDKKANKFVATMVGGEITGYNSDGSPIYSSKGPAGSHAAGTGKAGKPDDLVSQALAHFDSATKDSEDKLTVEQRAMARDHVARVAAQNPSVPAPMASRIAIDAARNPQKLTPAINPDTGLIDSVYDDGSNGKVVFQPGVASARSPGQLSAPQLQQMTNAMLAKKAEPERKALIAAANDPVARRTMEDGMRSTAQAEIAKRVAGLPPEQAAFVTKQINAGLEQKLGYLANNLDLIYGHGPKPAPVVGPAAAGAGTKIQPAGGMYRQPTPQQRAEKVAAARSKIESDKAAAVQEAAQQAASALAAGDVEAAAKVQAKSAFGELDRDTKMKIYKLVNGIQ